MIDVVIIHQKRADLPMELVSRHVDMIKSEVSGEVYVFGTENEALQAQADGEVLFTWCGSGELPVEFCRRSKKLRWIHSFSAGVNPVFDTPIAEMPILLTNGKGLHGKTMSVTATGYIISFLRGFPEYRRRQQAHVWNKHDVLLREPDGLVVGIIGAGAIGSEVARMAKALNMTVLGVKRKAEPLENFDAVYPNTEMDKVLSMSDFVVILTPLTDETYHLIDARRIAAMKPSAYLINIARGQVVDTNALTEALRNGVIAGAALDAVDPEPLNADNPLWDMNNVIITPHCSADSDVFMDHAVRQFCENLKRYQNGEPLFNRIDLQKAY